MEGEPINEGRLFFRMRWHGHVERNTGWIAKARQLDGGWAEEIQHIKETRDEVSSYDRVKLGLVFGIRTQLERSKSVVRMA